MSDRVDLSFGPERPESTPFVPAGGRLPDYASVAAWTCASNFVGLGGAMQHPGGPAMYSTAVTNALVVIVAAHWPDEVRRRAGGMKSASQLLAVIEEHEPPCADGVVYVRAGPRTVRIDVLRLRATIDRLDAVRHGRGDDSDLLPDDHRALEELTTHPALSGVVRGERQDVDELSALAIDGDEVARSSSYLELLSPTEVERRARAAADDAAVAVGDIQLCTVCLQDTFLVSSVDSLGVGIGVGVCIVCSYERGSVAAELEARHVRYVEAESG